MDSFLKLCQQQEMQKLALIIFIMKSKSLAANLLFVTQVLVAVVILSQN
jgi:hypothetical protein